MTPFDDPWFWVSVFAVALTVTTHLNSRFLRNRVNRLRESLNNQLEAVKGLQAERAVMLAELEVSKLCEEVPRPDYPVVAEFRRAVREIEDRLAVFAHDHDVYMVELKARRALDNRVETMPSVEVER